MSFEALSTWGRVRPDGSDIATWGRTAKYKVPINDLMEIIAELQTEINFTVSIYDATINIETGICEFRDIKTTIAQEQDLESKLQKELDIKTRLVKAFQTPSL